MYVASRLPVCTVCTVLITVLFCQPAAASCHTKQMHASAWAPVSLSLIGAAAQSLHPSDCVAEGGVLHCMYWAPIIASKTIRPEYLVHNHTTKIPSFHLAKLFIIPLFPAHRSMSPLSSTVATIKSRPLIATAVEITCSGAEHPCRIACGYASFQRRR